MMTAMVAQRMASRPRIVAATAGAVLAAVVVVALAGCSAEPAASAGPAKTSATTPPSPSLSTTASTATTPATGSTSATPTAVPPFVARVQWVRGSGGRSLQIFPTASGRAAQGTLDDDEAWREVLRLAPDADQPGLRAQFDCHWTFARLVDPDKPSWNIEPWRPVVPDSQMVDARCNPGAPESAES
jgi:hypothetical protein